MQQTQNIEVDWSVIERDPLGPAIAYQSYLASLPETWRREDRADALETLAHVCEQINCLIPGCAEWTDAIENAYHLLAEVNAR